MTRLVPLGLFLAAALIRTTETIFEIWNNKDYSERGLYLKTFMLFFR